MRLYAVLTLFLFIVLLVLDKKGTFLSSMGILLDVGWRYEGGYLSNREHVVSLYVLNLPVRNNKNSRCPS